MTNILEPGQDLVVTSSLVIDDEAKLDGAIVLRAFEALRRDLARNLEGDSGIGLGYDLLDIHWARLRDLEAGAQLDLSATLLSRTPGRHEVEYVASAGPAHVVRARGWTLNPGVRAGSVAASTNDWS